MPRTYIPTGRPIGRPPELSTIDLVEALAAQPGRQVNAKRRLEEITGKSRTTVDRVLKPLIARGIVESFPMPKNARGYRLRK